MSNKYIFDHFRPETQKIRHFLIYQLYLVLVAEIHRERRECLVQLSVYMYIAVQRLIIDQVKHWKTLTLTIIVTITSICCTKICMSKYSYTHIIAFSERVWGYFESQKVLKIIEKPLQQSAIIRTSVIEQFKLVKRRNNRYFRYKIWFFLFSTRTAQRCGQYDVYIKLDPLDRQVAKEFSRLLQWKRFGLLTKDV